MDIVAHGLWVGIALVVVHRHRPIPRRTALATVGLAVLPDLAQLLPLLGLAAFGAGGWSVLLAYATALPGAEPALPPTVALISHHLHCTLHSAVVAGAVSAVLYAVTRSWWLPLLGWWSHIVIDVFTHSAEFYPVPVLYPFTQRGFDGLAWNTPWFMGLNYAAIVAAATWLAVRWYRSRA